MRHLKPFWREDLTLYPAIHIHFSFPSLRILFFPHILLYYTSETSKKQASECVRVCVHHYQTSRLLCLPSLISPSFSLHSSLLVFLPLLKSAFPFLSCSLPFLPSQSHPPQLLFSVPSRTAFSTSLTSVSCPSPLASSLQHHDNSQTKGVGASQEAVGPPERTYKVVFAGDAAVGKSTFIVRVCKGYFVNNIASTLGKLPSPCIFSPCSR